MLNKPILNLHSRFRVPSTTEAKQKSAVDVGVTGVEASHVLFVVLILSRPHWPMSISPVLVDSIFLFF